MASKSYEDIEILPATDDARLVIEVDGHLYSVCNVYVDDDGDVMIEAGEEI